MVCAYIPVATTVCYRADALSGPIIPSMFVARIGRFSLLRPHERVFFQAEHWPICTTVIGTAVLVVAIDLIPVLTKTSRSLRLCGDFFGCGPAAVNFISLWRA